MVEQRNEATAGIEMPRRHLLRRHGDALLLGTAIMASGCSTEPVRQPAAPEAVVEIDRTPSVPRPAPTPTATPSSAVAKTSETAPRLTVDGDGLRWFLPPGGSARPVAFGASQAQVLSAVQALRGRAKLATNQDCGAGPVHFATWDDGLSLVFQQERFVGWGLGKRASGTIGTAAGVGPGTTRVDLEAAYAATIDETTLGTEFAAGDIHGVLDGSSASARITDMWAGVSCVAR